jgi:hypothetical protein
LAWGTDFTAARTTLEGLNVDTENPTRPSEYYPVSNSNTETDFRPDFDSMPPSQS